MRALLAVLAAASPDVVAAPALEDMLWCDGRAADPTSALHAAVSHLRRRLGAAAIVRESGGYRLGVSKDDVDVLRMESSLIEGRRALDEGRFRLAAEALEHGLAEWRAEPLVEFHDIPLIRNSATLWTERYLSGHEDLIAADLELGHHDEVVVRASELVEAFPLRERLRARLMLALYRSGRAAEALRVGHDGRRLLSDELGLEPGPELVEMERAILDHDPDIRSTQPGPSTVSAPPPASRARPPLPLSSFTGREDELADLTALVARHPLVTLVGPVGVGKCRLAVELSHRVSSEVVYVDLGAVAHDDDVAETIAIAFEKPAGGSEWGLQAPSPVDRVAPSFGDCADRSRGYQLRRPR
jgi:DNA-binding SARP family transcriptional activator